MIEVSEIWVYPIKACAGVRVRQAKVERRGLEWDRRYMVVDAAGRFFTQREEPGLQGVRTQLQDDAVLMTTPAGSCVLPRLMIDGPRVPVRVWDSDCEALLHAEGSRLLSVTLDRELRLVCMPDDVERRVDEGYAEPGDIVSFADAFPLLLANQASLDDLNGVLDEAVSMERFRPNVVVRGVSAFAEEQWQRVQIGATSCRAVSACTRCAVINVDPSTASRSSKQPLAKLTQHHAPDGKPVFGVNVTPDIEGHVKVGDAVAVS
jgi:hypothetical protein